MFLKTHCQTLFLWTLQNVLEFSVYDEDAVSADDYLFTLCFDISRLPVGERVLTTFKPDPQVRSEITQT